MPNYSLDTEFWYPERVTQGGRAASQYELPLGWNGLLPLVASFVKNFTIFEVSGTGRQGRQPIRATARLEWSAPVGRELCEKLHDL